MKEKLDLRKEVKEMAKKAKEASRLLAQTSTDLKDKALFEMADELERGREQLIKENNRDLAAGEKLHLSSAMMDRLRLTPATAEAGRW